MQTLLDSLIGLELQYFPLYYGVISDLRENVMVHAILSLCCRACADCMAISLLLAAACSDSAHVHLVAVGARLENSKNVLCLSLSI